MINQHQYDIALKIVSYGVIIPFFLLFFTREAREFYKDVLNFAGKKLHLSYKSNAHISEAKEYRKYFFEILNEAPRSSSIDWGIAQPLSKNLKVVEVFFDEFEYQNERLVGRIQSARSRKTSGQDRTNVGFQLSF